MLKKILLLVLLSKQLIFYAQDYQISLISWNIKDFGKTKNDTELNEIANIVEDTDILDIQGVVGFGGAQIFIGLKISIT